MSLFAPNPAIFAQTAWTAIQDKPVELVVIRNNVAQAAQVVRVEYSSGSVKQRGAVATPGRQGVTVFGIRDHATLPDTDIKAQDVFAWDGKMHEVVMVIRTIGEIQAICEAKS